MLSRRPAAVFVVTLIVWTATNGRTAAGDLQSGTRTASPTFEVASVKPTSSSPGPVRIEALPGGRFVATNVTLRALIQTAYRLQPFQVIGGPSWLSSDRFDIVAKADPADADQNAASDSAGPSRTQLMLRALLEDRFRLATRAESRELPMYALVVARSDGRLGSALHPAAADCRAQTAATAGSVLKAAPPSADGKPCGIQTGLGSLTVGGATLAQLASALSGLLDRTVVDRTGLAGAFDAALKWTPDESTPGMAQKAKFVPAIDPNGPSIFTAVQEQLGLKLDPTRGPVDVLVVVSAQPPSPN
jgi:uncharacterized protein (TIGR03435 family)